MSFVRGKDAADRENSDHWIEENRPENGVFRIYYGDKIHSIPKGYKNIGILETDVTLDGEGRQLRWEMYYKDGKRADGISHGWWPDGKLKQTISWKDGKLDGLRTEYYENGQKEHIRIYKEGECLSEASWWKRTGQRKSEGTYKGSWIQHGKWTFWDRDGKKWKEEIFKEGEKISVQEFTGPFNHEH
jgi:antitoxin component YwqK of YwqJK toxin-antitoxin module